MELIASDKTPAWSMYRTLVGISVVCALIIVAAYLATRSPIEHNRALMLRAAVLAVLPGAVTHREFELESMVYAGFDADGRLVGVALTAEGMGYQDLIRLLYGYDPVAQRIIGLQILSSRETPGLGDKIAKDASFGRNFSALDVRVGQNGLLAHPIEFVRSGARTNAWQIDGITGATVSSAAVAGIVGASSSVWVPRIHERRIAFVQQGDNP